MPRTIPGPYPPEEMRRFLDSFMYEDDAFLVDEVTRLDPARREIEGRLDTTRTLPITRRQRSDDSHPAHVAAPELIMVTGCLGCLSAWFFHGCRWDEGWVGFGNRIHRADFKTLARIGPPLDLRSRETRSRVGASRIVVRYEFEFEQEGRMVYLGDQSAMFFKGKFEG
ncbi:MAG: hypothetical protein OEQ13_05350 [Acidobacteriota bacterium]|nr:hypothetical protein [Acidobacteriota bacterium]